MSYFEDRDVAPDPNDDDEAYWANCAQRRLTFQQCGACKAVTHPPISVCPQCQSLDRGWIEAPTEATVFSFTWIHSAAHDSVTRSLPYNVVVVEFPSLPSVRLISNVVDAEPTSLHIGDALTMVWEDIGGGMLLPRFRLAALTRT